MTGATMRIGAFSFSVSIPVAEADLAQEISDLYGLYPQVGAGELTDFAITLTYPNLWRRFVGREIQVSFDGVPTYEPWPPALGVPMLESAINWCMGRDITRFLLIHAGVVERGGQALLLPGVSGAGKSTLCALLASRGWRLLSDEIAMVRPADGSILPHPRPISLKNKSIDLMVERLPAAYFTKRFEGTTKATVASVRPPEDDIDRAMEAATPAVVVFPQYNADGQTGLERLERAHAFMKLIDNAPQYSTLLETGFETLATLVDACEHYSLSYRSTDDAICLLEGLLPVIRDQSLERES